MEQLQSAKSTLYNVAKTSYNLAESLGDVTATSCNVAVNSMSTLKNTAIGGIKSMTSSISSWFWGSSSDNQNVENEQEVELRVKDSENNPSLDSVDDAQTNAIGQIQDVNQPAQEEAQQGLLSGIRSGVENTLEKGKNRVRDLTVDMVAGTATALTNHVVIDQASTNILSCLFKLRIA